MMNKKSGMPLLLPFRHWPKRFKCNLLQPCKNLHQTHSGTSSGRRSGAGQIAAEPPGHKKMTSFAAGRVFKNRPTTIFKNEVPHKSTSQGL
jgi:hypothetical protein